jgi:hypothetical protein
MMVAERFGPGGHFPLIILLLLLLLKSAAVEGRGTPNNILLFILVLVAKVAIVVDTRKLLSWCDAPTDFERFPRRFAAKRSLPEWRAFNNQLLPFSAAVVEVDVEEGEFLWWFWLSGDLWC